MKIKQRSIRVFEIECDTLEGADEFIEKNIEILKDFFVLLKGSFALEVYPLAQRYGLTCMVSEGVSAFGAKEKAKETNVIVQNESLFSNKEDKSPAENQDNLVNVTQTIVCRTLYDRPIRSGEEIIIEGDGTIVGRINGGSRVIVHGNGAFFDQIDGMVICDGSFALIRSIGKGSLIFCGEIIDKDILSHYGTQSGMKRVSMSEGKLIIKDIL